MRDWWNKNLDYLPLGARWRGKWQQGQVRRMIREIDERKLDIEIAEKVFGYKVTIVEFSDYDSVMESYYPELAIKIEHKAEEDDYQFDTWIEEIHLPNYSTDIKHAWKIVEKMQSCCWLVEIGASRYKSVANTEVDEYDCNINHGGLLGNEIRAYRTGKSAPEAICNAALQAFNGK